MRKTSIFILVAVLCIVAGLVIMVVGLAGCGFQLSDLSNLQAETNEHVVADPFSTLDLHTVEADLTILPAEGGVCRVVCEETDKIAHTVAVRDGKLVIERQDGRPWYERIGFFGQRFSITIYLPGDAYGALTAETVSGDISIADALAFQNAALSTTSGDITCAAKTAGSLTASAVSGDITLSQHTGGPLAMSTTSGAINIAQTDASAITLSSVSGNITLQGVQALGLLQAESVSGEQRFTRTDAGRLSLSAVSGSITAELLSGKDFSYDTVSGYVSLPPDTAGAGECRIETTSGSIRVSVAA